MKSLRRVRITGTGMYVPPKVVTNSDLEKLMDTSDEWIQQRSGICERRYAEDGVGPSHLAHEASLKAIEAAGIDKGQIDLVIVASLSPDYYFPGVSSFLQDHLGLGTTPAFDVRNQCSGFIYALNIGQLYVATGQYDRVLVVGAEVHSSALNFTTAGRDVAVLFGDGAGAVILEPSDDPEHGIMSVALHTEGEHRDRLKVQFPGTIQKPYVREENIKENTIYPHMEGRHVFKNAVQRLTEVSLEVLADNHLTPDDVDFFAFHQANLRINEFVMKQLEQDISKTHNNIQKYGNCSAASVPMVLDEAVRAGRVKSGDIVCLSAFGAGYSWGGALLRW